MSKKEKVGVENNVLSLEEIEKHTSFDILQKNLHEIERKLDIKVSKYQFTAHI